MTIKNNFFALLFGLCCLSLVACGASPGSRQSTHNQGNTTSQPPANISPSSCKGASAGSQLFTDCEAQNFAKTSEAPNEQSADPGFQARYETQSLENFIEFGLRQTTDPFFDTTGNVCATWGQNCVGDPFRYPGTDAFYTDIGEVTPINFYDSEGARLNGRVWAPRAVNPGQTFPGVVIINGSVQAPETLYWWGAQLLVANGYIVMTFDPRGQGRSDNRTPDGQQGSNANPVVFRRNLIDAIEFFYSSPTNVYVHNLPGTPGHTSDNGLAGTTEFNPIHALLDRDRFGVIGHSLGATGVSVVQGENPWAGAMLSQNPIDAVVAWDNLALASGLDGVDVVPRVPAMGQSADYFLTPAPYTTPPNEEDKNGGFENWRTANVPSFQVNIRGGTHYEWSLLPQFPTSSWQAGVIDPGADSSGWGQPLAQHYTLAWMDRWLKLPGEPGYDSADTRLQADADWADRMSFYFPSRRAYPDRAGTPQVCEDIASGCPLPPK